MIGPNAAPAERLYIITERSQARDGLGAVESVVESAVRAGARLLQFRDKSMPTEERHDLGERLADICGEFGVELLVNGRADLARCLDADGVHRPSAGLPVECLRRVAGEEATIAVSTHDREELEDADAAGADFATLSPVWSSPSKPNYGPALGLDTFADLATDVELPVLALGGVTPDRVEGCIEAGAAGVGVMSGVMAAERPSRQVEQYLRALEDAT